MKQIIFIFLTLFASLFSRAQRMEVIYLNAQDSTSNKYLAVFPVEKEVQSWMILLDGFGNSVENVLQQTDLPKKAAESGMLTIIPVLKTGQEYFGSDEASQQSLKEMIELVASKYTLQNKDFYIGGFSIGGTCAVKYAELAVERAYSIRPKALFAIASPLDWERYYNAAKRVVRLAKGEKVNSEVYYMINRIEKEMLGSPGEALENYYAQSPYSFSDTTQKAIKSLVNTPVMLVSEPDIQWWLKERVYDLSYNNVPDHVAMINELQKLGNKHAVLITTTDKGFRNPEHTRHPHSWSIADSDELIRWLLSFE